MKHPGTNVTRKHFPGAHHRPRRKKVLDRGPRLFPYVHKQKTRPSSGGNDDIPTYTNGTFRSYYRGGTTFKY